MRMRQLLLGTVMGMSLIFSSNFGCGEGAEMRTKRNTGEIRLPAPVTKGKVSIEETLVGRRSVRAFAMKELTPEQFGQLAWAAQGITEPGRGFRTAPSAGATYPLELYLVKKDGVYRYRPEGHVLIKVSGEDVRGPLARAALGQSFVEQAPVDIVMTAVYARTRARYGSRAERYVHMEAGHVAENVHLQAVALGLGSVPVGAFDDKAVKRVMNLPAEEAPLYIIPVGYAK